MAVLRREVRIPGLWMVVLRREVRISGMGEDIWLAALGREVRISGPGEDIWLAALRREVRISGNGPPPPELRPHICSPLACGSLWAPRGELSCDLCNLSMQGHGPCSWSIPHSQDLAAGSNLCSG